MTVLAGEILEATGGYFIEGADGCLMYDQYDDHKEIWFRYRDNAEEFAKFNGGKIVPITNRK